MRQCLDGFGNDSTAAVKAYLLNNSSPRLRTLYLIGFPEDPYALWLTDNESDLVYSFWGTFVHAVVTRGSVEVKIGLESTSMDLDYSPALPRAFGVTTATMNPLQLAQLGFYDNWPVRAWTVFLPTAGDANSLGACELFGGRIGETTVDRSGIHWKVNSYLYVADINIPPNLIESTNVQASFLGAIPPAGLGTVPTFHVATLGTSTASFSAICDGPTPGQIFSNNTFAQGYLVFTSGSLEGFFSAVADNFSGGGHNIFDVYAPFIAPPQPGDTFYVSAKSPIDQSDTTEFFGWPYVPDPTQSI